jgi:hypothetical protein
VVALPIKTGPSLRQPLPKNEHSHLPFQRELQQFRHSSALFNPDLDISDDIHQLFFERSRDSRWIFLARVR